MYFLKIGTRDMRFEWLLGSMNCEGVRGDKKVLKMLRVQDVVRKEKNDDLKIMIGGDINAHKWKLDKCENKNGKRLKNMVRVEFTDFELCIGACEWGYMVPRE